MANRKKAPLDQGTIRIFIEMAVLLAVIIVLLVLIGNVNAGTNPEETTPSTTENTLPSVETVPVDTSPEGIFQAFLKEHNLSKDDYTETMIEN